MKTENKHKYYNDGDEINFEKLNNFRKFNSNFKNSIQLNNHNIKYANSDKNYFNDILKTDQKVPRYNENEAEKDINYYNSSDFQKFDKLDNFSEYNDNLKQLNENITPKSDYSSKDYNEFDKIIPNINMDKKKIGNQNKKIRVVDYSKINEGEKKLKNKFGIDKIKIVYFD